MGFYSPATIVKDAKRHGVRFRPVCAAISDWRCTIEPDDSIRLGFCVVQGLRPEHGQQIVSERQRRAFKSLDEFQTPPRPEQNELRRLAEIGALNCFAEHRRDALWKAERELHENDLFDSAIAAASPPPSRGREVQGEGEPANSDDDSPLLPMTPIERLRADYEGMRLTTGPHPMALMRPQLPDAWRAVDIHAAAKVKSSASPAMSSAGSAQGLPKAWSSSASRTKLASVMRSSARSYSKNSAW